MCLQAASLRTMFRQSALILMLLCHINDIRLLLPLVDNGAKLLYLCKDPFLQLVHKTFYYYYSFRDPTTSMPASWTATDRRTPTLVHRVCHILFILYLNPLISHRS